MFGRLWIIVFIGSFLLSSCETKVIDARMHSSVSNSNDRIECNTSIYGDDCKNLDDFIVVKKDELVASNIKQGRSIGGVTGTLVQGSYLACNEDGEVGCVSNAEYKAINVNNHKSKIISGQSILGVEGSFVVPSTSNVVSSSSYGIAGSMNGMIPDCSDGNSGCYIKPYDGGVSGFTLKALDYDVINAGASHIRSGYTIAGVSGTQPECADGGSSCYINSSFKAVSVSELVASNIKRGVSLGLVAGTFGYSECSSTSHTGCIATDSYPSVSANLTSSLLASASINNVPGTITNCTNAGDSSCYIATNNFKAAETSLLLASNIKKGVSLGGVTGNYPSALYPLEGSSNTIQDLTSSNFNSSIISSDAFEWFDSAGNRHIRTGDPDIVKDQIKVGKTLLGVNGSYYAHEPYRAAGNKFGFAVIDNNGGVHYEGIEKDSSWVSFSSVSASLTSDVIGVFATSESFAALKSDGSVKTWGDEEYGGSSSGVSGYLSSGVKEIFSARECFVMVKEDGTVLIVGNGYSGEVASFTNIEDFAATKNEYDKAFAAIKSNGSVVTWGNSSYGGTIPGDLESYLSSGVIKIVSTYGGFAALKNNGNVYSWGNDLGDYNTIKSSLTNVVTLISNSGAFAALKDDGTVIAWGEAGSGGDPTYEFESISRANGSLTDVQRIYASSGAFVALKTDGSVVSWGWYGDASGVEGDLVNVKYIFTNDASFAALRTDGSVITWGSEGGGNSEGVSSYLESGVEKIFATKSAFAALKSDGSVVAWGFDAHGGNMSDNSYRVYQGNGSFTNIVNIYPSYINDSGEYFIGLKSDGSYIAWGSWNN